MATTIKGLLIPGGRFIMGDLMKKGDKDAKGAPIPVEKQRYFFGVAVPKGSPGLNELWGQLYNLAATDYANVPLVMMQISKGLREPSDFSWKIEDGDWPVYDKATGQVKPQSELTKGCMIFKFGTQFEIGACNVEGRDISRADIKRGDYVDVLFDSTINGNNDHTAGIYLNPKAIRLLGYGEAITAGLPASAAFAGKAAHVPVGASQMPTAGGIGMPPVPGAAPPMGMPGVSAAALPPMGAPPAPPPPPAPPAQFPPAGWTAHPSAPGFYYAGQEVLSEADLRARFTAPAPAPMGHVPAGMPGLPAPQPTAFPGSYPGILNPGGV